MPTGGGVQRAARPDFILKCTVRFFFFFFFFLLFQPQQQQIYAPNYVWLWLNQFAFPEHTLAGGRGNRQGKEVAREDAKRWGGSSWRKMLTHSNGTTNEAPGSQPHCTGAQRSPRGGASGVPPRAPIHSFIPSPCQYLRKAHDRQTLNQEIRKLQ